VNQFPSPAQHPPAPAAQPPRRRSTMHQQTQGLSQPFAQPLYQQQPQPVQHSSAPYPASQSPLPAHPVPHQQPPRHKAPIEQHQVHQNNIETHKKEKPKKRTSSPIISVWQTAFLGLLLVCVLVLVYLMLHFQKGIRDIHEQNTQAQRAYQRMVEQHRVEYESWIRYYAAANNLDPAYVAAIIMTESSYDPQAVNKRTQATGLMQFMADTLEWVGPKFGVDGHDMNALKDPETAIKLGCYLLNYITKQFDGDPILTACAYHAGWGNVRSWLTKYSTDGKTLSIDQIPTDDTRNYARKVLNSYAIYQQHHY